MRSLRRWSISTPTRATIRVRTSSKKPVMPYSAAVSSDSAMQCRHAARGHDAVVDLQHEQRAGQHQDVDQEAEDGERDESGLAGEDRGFDLIVAGGVVRRRYPRGEAGGGDFC